MKVVYNSRRFKIELEPHEKGMLDGLHARRWHDKLRAWVCPITPHNVQYLSQFCQLQGNPMAPWSVGQVPETYQFKTQPFEHQLQELLVGLNLAHHALFMAPGTGKSKVMIDDASIQYTLGNLNGVALLAPNSILSNWEDELKIHCPVPFSSFVYQPEKKRQVVNWMSSLPKNRLNWLIISIETMSHGEGIDFLEGFMTLGKMGLYLDESSRIKLHDAKRSKRLHKVSPSAVRTRIATGTPFLKGLHDAWSQFQFLSKEILDLNFFAFRNTFCLMGGFNRKVIVGDKNVDLFQDLTRHWTSVVEKDILGLPPKVYQVRRVTPTKPQTDLYKQLKKEGTVALGTGTVDIMNVLVEDLRLHQLTGGFLTVTIPDEAGSPEETVQDRKLSEEDLLAEDISSLLPKTKIEPIPGKNPKLEELLEIVDEIPGKMLVWCRFRAEIDLVAKALSAIAPTVVFHGGCSNEERTVARKEFQENPTIRFFVAQTDTGGIGITLTAAQTAVYFSNSWRLESRIQNEDRCHRIGTKGTVLYIDLVLDGPFIDSKVHKALKAGKDYAANRIRTLRTGIVEDEDEY